MNEPSSFVELVRAMRAAQQKYFKSRTQTDLQRAKNLERQVDTQLDKVPVRPPEAQQLTLTHSNPSTTELTVDHIVAESKGGPLTMENARTLCKSCNSRKGAR